jgi:hypothetical protein
LIAITVLVVSSVAVAIFVVNLTRDGVDHYSGIFTMRVEHHNKDSWTFSARNAQGYSIIFHDLSQEDLDNFSVTSHFTDGEMSLILSQGDNVQTIDLSKETIQMSAEDLNMNTFNPGRISMQLKFNDAKNIDVHIGWN